MRNQRGSIGRVAGLAAIAILLTTAGGAVATATAQADVGQVTHNIALDRDDHGRHVLREGGPADRFLDHVFNDDGMHNRHVFREGGRADRFLDHFFNDDRMGGRN